MIGIAKLVVALIMIVIAFIFCGATRAVGGGSNFPRNEVDTPAILERQYDAVLDDIRKYAGI